MEVASITGHKDLRMLRRYTHLSAEDLVGRLINKVTNLLLGLRWPGWSWHP